MDRVFAHVGGGALFAGPYGAISFSTAETEGLLVTETVAGTTTTRTEALTTAAEHRELELGLRAGWANERLALYASTALVNARRDAATSTMTAVTTPDPVDPMNTVTTTTTDDSPEMAAYRDGWRVGLGGEVTLPADLYLRAGYAYTRYDEDDERHQVTTGLGLRF